MATQQIWYYRAQWIPKGTSRDDLWDAFAEEDRPHVEIQSLSQAVDDPDYLTATLSFNAPYARTHPPNVLAETGLDEIEFDDKFEGFTPLYHAASNRINADIIAVTGLAGHALNSWANGLQVWLRDYLPKSLSDARINPRILVFGYNSQIVQARGRSILDDHVGDFKEKLVNVRDNVLCRPIIFIGHSLGCLLIKKTLYEINKNADDLSWLDVGAIVFMGAPHRGLEINALRTMVKGQPSEALVAELERESPTITNLSSCFRQVVKNTPILTLYEMHLTPTVEQHPDGSWKKTGPPMMMVSKDSAVLSLPKETVVACQCDHSQIAKLRRGQSGHYNTVTRFLRDILISRKSKPRKPPIRARQWIHDAAQGNDVHAAKVVLATGDDDLDAREPHQGYPPLIVAARANSYELASFLLRAGADVNARADDDHTALYEAAFYSHTELIKLFVDAGAHVETRKLQSAEGNRSALHECAQRGNLDGVRILLQAGANVNVAAVGDCFGQTPLHDAAREGHVEIVNELLSRGANIDARLRSAADETPLHQAIRNGGHLEVVKELLAAGANPDAARTSNHTALHDAAYAGHLRIAELLLEYGADPNVRGHDENQHTPLDTARASPIVKNVWQFEKLLAAADTNARNNQEPTLRAMIPGGQNIGANKNYSRFGGANVLSARFLHTKGGLLEEYRARDRVSEEVDLGPAVTTTEGEDASRGSTRAPTGITVSDDFLKLNGWTQLEPTENSAEESKLHWKVQELEEDLYKLETTEAGRRLRDKYLREIEQREQELEATQARLREAEADKAWYQNEWHDNEGLLARTKDEKATFEIRLKEAQSRIHDLKTAGLGTRQIIFRKLDPIDNWRPAHS
ncbi:MAG: hypothetical protein M1820_005573 [Bogoriella megaspora]|nr:MAG: hypothetical protein M1820_005573 [Bogoriella megaspora]